MYQGTKSRSSINNKKWGQRARFSVMGRLKLKIKVFSAGHAVTLVTYCVMKNKDNHDTIVVASTNTLVITGAHWAPGNK